LLQLKLQMCFKIGVDISEVTIKRNSKTGIEIKDLSKAIQTTSLSNGSKIFISFGAPSQLDEYRVHISLARKQKGIRI